MRELLRLHERGRFSIFSSYSTKILYFIASHLQNFGMIRILGVKYG